MEAFGAGKFCGVSVCLVKRQQTCEHFLFCRMHSQPQDFRGLDDWIGLFDGANLVSGGSLLSCLEFDDAAMFDLAGVAFAEDFLGAEGVGFGVTSAFDFDSGFAAEAFPDLLRQLHGNSKLESKPTAPATQVRSTVRTNSSIRRTSVVLNDANRDGAGRNRRCLDSRRVDQLRHGAFPGGIEFKVIQQLLLCPNNHAAATAKRIRTRPRTPIIGDCDFQIHMPIFGSI
jgi:hypothetical protein